MWHDSWKITKNRDFLFRNLDLLENLSRICSVDSPNTSDTNEMFVNMLRSDESRRDNLYKLILLISGRDMEFDCGKVSIDIEKYSSPWCVEEQVTYLHLLQNDKILQSGNYFIRNVHHHSTMNGTKKNRTKIQSTNLSDVI